MFSKGGKRRPKALKQLAQQELGLTIQEGQHSSVDDARAALYLYQKHAGTVVACSWLVVVQQTHGVVLTVILAVLPRSCAVPREGCMACS